MQFLKSTSKERLIKINFGNSFLRLLHTKIIRFIPNSALENAELQQLLFFNTLVGWFGFTSCYKALFE